MDLYTARFLGNSIQIKVKLTLQSCTEILGFRTFSIVRKFPK
jgi:hypothetical protein